MLLHVLEGIFIVAGIIVLLSHMTHLIRGEFWRGVMYATVMMIGQILFMAIVCRPPVAPILAGVASLAAFVFMLSALSFLWAVYTPGLKSPANATPPGRIGRTLICIGTIYHAWFGVWVDRFTANWCIRKRWRLFARWLTLVVVSVELIEKLVKVVGFDLWGG